MTDWELALPDTEAMGRAGAKADRLGRLASGHPPVTLAITEEIPYLPGMLAVSPTDAESLAPGEETASERARRIAREAEMIAEARAAVATGRTVSFEAVSAWIDSLGTDHELPPPQSGR